MYEVWCFAGTKDESDKLFELVKCGKKTATSYLGNSDECEYSYVSNYDNTDRVLIKTTKIYKVEFNKVSKEHAFKEGEGDLSLKYWRQVHKDFFSKVCEEQGIKFDEKILITCEEFEVIKQ